MAEGKIHENRIRRIAERQGFILKKSRRRDRLAQDFGGCWLLDAQTGGLAFPLDVRADIGATLYEAEDWLTNERVNRETFVEARIAANRANEVLHDLRLRGIESGLEWQAALRQLHLANAVITRQNYFEKVTRTSVVSQALAAIEATCGHRHARRGEAEDCGDVGEGNLVIERTFAGSDIGLFFVRQTQARVEPS